MLAILAAILFVLYAFGIDHFGQVGVLGLGLALLALALVVPWAPWPRRAG